jgi:hypothetical protein
VWGTKRSEFLPGMLSSWLGLDSAFLTQESPWKAGLLEREACTHGYRAALTWYWLRCLLQCLKFLIISQFSFVMSGALSGAYSRVSSGQCAGKAAAVLP